MQWRTATPADLAWMEALLLKRIESSMFLLGNLREHGLAGDADHAMRFWVLPDRSGLFAIANNGSVMMQAPGATVAQWQAAGALICDRALSGVLGDAPQSRAFLQAAGLNAAKTQLDHDDPGFVLDLEDLILDMREGETLLPLGEAPRDLVERWRADYQIEAIREDPATALETAQGQVGQFLAKDSHRVLFENGRPVATTGLNMVLAEAVQVGGVFTPKAQRGKGYARRAVAHHLAEARESGATKAVLFAASEAAAKAYRAIGFQPAGAYALILFDPSALPRTSSVEACT